MMDIVAILAGYAFALVGGYFGVSVVVELLWKLDPNPRAVNPPQGSRLIGLVERALYVTALLIGREAFILVWLLMKVATDWKLERHRGRPPKLAYNTFLVGTGLSLLFAVAGGMVVQWGMAEDPSLWWNALYLGVALLLGVEIARRILLHSLKPEPPAGTENAALVDQQAEPVNELFADAPPDLDPDGPEESLEDAGEPLDGPFGEVDLVLTLQAVGDDGRLEKLGQVELSELISGGEEDVPVVELEPQRRSRRTPEEIAELNAAVLDHLRANPWQGANEIAAALGVESQELRRPLHVLLANRQIRKRGQGRTTEYRTGTVRKRKTKKKTAGRARSR